MGLLERIENVFLDCVVNETLWAIFPCTSEATAIILFMSSAIKYNVLDVGYLVSYAHFEFFFELLLICSGRCEFFGSLGGCIFRKLCSRNSCKIACPVWILLQSSIIGLIQRTTQNSFRVSFDLIDVTITTGSFHSSSKYSSSLILLLALWRFLFQEASVVQW